MKFILFLLYNNLNFICLSVSHAAFAFALDDALLSFCNSCFWQPKFIKGEASKRTELHYASCLAGRCLPSLAAPRWRPSPIEAVGPTREAQSPWKATPFVAVGNTRRAQSPVKVQAPMDNRPTRRRKPNWRRRTLGPKKGVDPKGAIGPVGSQAKKAVASTGGRSLP